MKISPITTFLSTFLFVSSRAIAEYHSDENNSVFYSDPLEFDQHSASQTMVCEDFSNTNLQYNQTSHCGEIGLSASSLDCNLTSLQEGFTLSSTFNEIEQDLAPFVLFTGGRLSPDRNVLLFRYTGEMGMILLEDDNDDDVTAFSMEVALLDVDGSDTATILAYGDNEEFLGELEIQRAPDVTGDNTDDNYPINSFQFVGLTSDRPIRKVMFSAPVLASFCFGSTSSHHQDDESEGFKYEHTVIGAVVGFFIGFLGCLSYQYRRNIAAICGNKPGVDEEEMQDSAASGKVAVERSSSGTESNSDSTPAVKMTSHEDELDDEELKDIDV